MPNDKISNRRRLLRLVEFIEAESSSHGVGDTDASHLFKCGDALRDRLAELSGDVEQASDEEVGRVVLDDSELTCPRYLASTTEGSGESTYRDNPTFHVGSAGEVGECLASSYEEGWACNWIIDLSSGQNVMWETRCCLLGEQYIRVTADTVEEGDWIVLDCDGKPGKEPRRVGTASENLTRIRFGFNDSDPDATFDRAGPVWRRRRDGEDAKLEKGEPDNTANAAAPPES